MITGYGTVNGRTVYVFARFSPFSVVLCRNARQENLSNNGRCGKWCTSYWVESFRRCKNSEGVVSSVVMQTYSIVTQFASE